MILSDLINSCQTRIEKIFNFYLLQQPSASPELQRAMAYAVINGGKHIRPLLVYATGYALEGIFENLDIPASAIELIHAYSLIHDDLPAMDNADLRRGKPSCHKAFGEAVAILAGDTLQPLAFEIIAAHPADLSAEQRLNMILTLSQASGLKGMAAGQVIDIAGTHSIDALTEMYQLKTGALLTAGVKLGAIAANMNDLSILNNLEIYAKSIGLAFQIQDDLLDLESHTQTGKSQGLDIINKKNTYPILLGIEKTRQIITELHEQAFSALDILGKKANLLRELTHFLLQRKK